LSGFIGDASYNLFDGQKQINVKLI